jgi:hypothetical protein
VIPWRAFSLLVWLAFGSTPILNKVRKTAGLIWRPKRIPVPVPRNNTLDIVSEGVAAQLVRVVLRICWGMVAKASVRLYGYSFIYVAVMGLVVFFGSHTAL